MPLRELAPVHHSFNTVRLVMKWNVSERNSEISITGNLHIKAICSAFLDGLRDTSIPGQGI